MYNPLEDFSFTDPFNTWWPFIFAAVIGVITTIRSFISGPTCPSEEHIDNKIVVITGGSRGIGAEVVIDLVRRGAKVIVGCRHPKEVTERLQKRIKSHWTGSIKAEMLDLAKLETVHKFAKRITESKIDVLINNAGVAFQPNVLTDDGFESHLAVNYLGHFLLIHLLYPKLKAASQGRIINTSAHVHHSADLNLDDINLQENFSCNKAFANSKLALLLMSRHLPICWQGSNVTVNCVNPGLVRGTGHVSNSLVSQSFAFKLMAAPTAWLLTKTPPQAAQTIIYLAVAKEVHNVSGRYFSNCSEIEPSEKAKDGELARRLYKLSLEKVKLRNSEGAIRK